MDARISGLTPPKPLALARKLASVNRADTGAIVWTLRAWWRVRWATRRSGLDIGAVVPAPPAPGSASARGVRVVLRFVRATCLERSLVRQAWLRGSGDKRALIIGVAPPDRKFHAHAWLEGEEPGDYLELTRRQPS